MHVDSIGPQDFGKVPFVTFGPANHTGDIHRVSGVLVCSVLYSSEIVKLKKNNNKNRTNDFNTFFKSTITS